MKVFNYSDFIYLLFSLVVTLRTNTLNHCIALKIKKKAKFNIPKGKYVSVQNFESISKGMPC